MRIYLSRDEMVRDQIWPGDQVLEIGVLAGQFSEVLLSRMPRKLFLCDPWDSSCPSGDADGNNVRVYKLPEEYLRLQEKYSRRPEVQLLKGYSPDALRDIPTQSLDFVYIDGDHSYEGCLRDLRAALHLVKPGGWICGHDYMMNPAKAQNNYNFGVKQAVARFCKETGLRVSALAMDGCVSYGIRLPGGAPSKGGAARPPASESSSPR